MLTPADVANVFDTGPIAFRVVRGLGLPGQVLVESFLADPETVSASASSQYEDRVV